jgi:hypothetical protein
MVYEKGSTYSTQTLYDVSKPSQIKVCLFSETVSYDVYLNKSEFP